MHLKTIVHQVHLQKFFNIQCIVHAIFNVPFKLDMAKFATTNFGTSELYVLSINVLIETDVAHLAKDFNYAAAAAQDNRSTTPLLDLYSPAFFFFFYSLAQYVYSDKPVVVKKEKKKKEQGNIRGADRRIKGRRGGIYT